MKVNRLTSFLVVAAIAAVQAMAGDKGGKDSVTTIEKVRSDLLNLDTIVLSSADALQKVKDNVKNSGELEKAIGAFNEQFESLESQSEAVRTSVVNMKARTKAYHEAWLKELEGMQNPKLKEKAASRFQEVKKEFDKIMGHGEEAKRAFVPYVADLKDIKIYLAADSTPEAISSLSNTIWKLGNRSKSVSGGIKNVIDQIDKTLEKAPKK